jgi:CDGSH-type Zn-finger protein
MNSKNEPYLVKGEKDKNYAWCACAESENQPFCDGKHAKTDQQPVVFKAEKDGDMYLCGCKKTSNAPYCDGSHLNL